MPLTSSEQIQLAQAMRDEFFLQRTALGFQSSFPAGYEISTDKALKIVKWFEKQPEIQHVEAQQRTR